MWVKWMGSVICCSVLCYVVWCCVSSAMLLAIWTTGGKVIGIEMGIEKGRGKRRRKRKGKRIGKG